MGADGDLAEQRLARGRRCFVVWIERAVGGYGWLSASPEWIGEVQLQIRPRAREGYVWNCVTVPEHRRKGIFRSLVIGISNVAHAEGLKRLWIGSVAIPAEKALSLAGFHPALHFTSMTAAGLHLLQVERADRKLAKEASDVLSISPGLHLRRSHTIRH